MVLEDEIAGSLAASRPKRETRRPARNENLDAIFTKEGYQEKAKEKKALHKLLGHDIKLREMDQSGDCFYEALSTAFDKVRARSFRCP